MQEFTCEKCSTKFTPVVLTGKVLKCGTQLEGKQ
jgi:DNA polymerase II large subunit